MFNYYLFNKSYETANSRSIEDNLRDLNDLVVDERNGGDSFLLHDSIWGLETVDGNFSDVVFSKLEDEQLRYTVLPRMFQAIGNIESEILSLKQFDDLYRIYNAFYGINFSEIELDRCINNKETYTAFREKNLWDVTPNLFWERREMLFSKIVLCDNVKNDIQTIGGTYLNQILIRLKELDEYVKNCWTAGNFNYEDANEKAPLNISTESKQTMGQKKYRDQRMFSLPDGRRECFELHIKTGNLRFHFFPENGFVYVGYIGKHLDTDKYN
ncbi:MAG TPA: hypothetical protein VF939_04110 [Puia sp.]